MVPPSGFADTVTPPMALPSDDLMVPLNSASAKAGTEIRMAAMAVRFAMMRPRRMGFSIFLVGIARRAGFDGRRRVGRRGNGFDVGDDGVDVRRPEWIYVTLIRYLRPVVRGVPVTMTSRMTSAVPWTMFIDSTGAYCGLTSCG